MALGPVFGGHPGEREIATYGDGQLVLTDRRIVHRKGRSKTQSLSLRLDEVSAVGVMRRHDFQARLLVVPFAVFLLGFLFAFVFEEEGPFIVGTFFGILTLPLPWLFGGVMFQVAVPGYTLSVRVPRRQVDAALAFVGEVEALRFAEPTGHEAHEAAIPTSRPFYA
jgi:hypothetical protein